MSNKELRQKMRSYFRDAKSDLIYDCQLYFDINNLDDHIFDLQTIRNTYTLKGVIALLGRDYREEIKGIMYES